MKVSVIIPAYNEEAYIEDCLMTVLNQDEKADEIIVVNNNSSDKTKEIASDMGVKVVDETQQGMIPTRNRGFNEAAFEIIARTDADTKVDISWIKNIKDFFRKNPEFSAVSGAAYYEGLPEYINQPLYNQYIGALNIILGYYPLVGPNMALKKTMWDKIKDKTCTDDRKVHEDIDLSIHINQEAGLIAYDSSIKVFSSTRRLKQNPRSFFLEYPYRVRKMLKDHGIRMHELKGIPRPNLNIAKIREKIKNTSA